MDRLVVLIFCLHFSYLLVHLPKLLATVWTRLPDSHLFSILSEYHYYYYYLIIIINISITIITNTSYHYHYISYYYHYYQYIVSLPLDQLLLWRLGISNQAEVYLDCSFLSFLLRSMMVISFVGILYGCGVLSTQLNCLFGTGSSIVCI